MITLTSRSCTCRTTAWAIKVPHEPCILANVMFVCFDVCCMEIGAKAICDVVKSPQGQLRYCALCIVNCIVSGILPIVVGSATSILYRNSDM